MVQFNWIKYPKLPPAFSLHASTSINKFYSICVILSTSFFMSFCSSGSLSLGHYIPIPNNINKPITIKFFVLYLMMNYTLLWYILRSIYMESFSCLMVNIHWNLFFNITVIWAFLFIILHWQNLNQFEINRTIKMAWK